MSPGGTLPTDGMPGRRAREARTSNVARELAGESVAAAAETAAFDRAQLANLPTVVHSDLYPDAEQVRKHFSDSDLDALGDNIAVEGIREPLQLYPRDSRGYMIHDGERRWRAIGRKIEQGALPRDFPIPFLIVTPIERERRGRAETRAKQLATSIHKQKYTALETVLAFLGISEEDPARPMAAAEIAQTFGFPKDVVEKNLRVARGLTAAELDSLVSAWPTAPLDPLEKLVGWLANAGLPDDSTARAEALRIFTRKKPTAKLVDTMLGHLAPRRARGRPPQKKFHVGPSRDGGFAVSLSIPVNRVRDPSTLAAARQDLEDALAKLRELEAELSDQANRSGTSAGGQ